MAACLMFCGVGKSAHRLEVDHVIALAAQALGVGALSWWTTLISEILSASAGCWHCLVALL
jgi:hypothetical protein